MVITDHHIGAFETYICVSAKIFLHILWFLQITDTFLMDTQINWWSGLVYTAGLIVKHLICLAKQSSKHHWISLEQFNYHYKNLGGAVYENSFLHIFFREHYGAIMDCGGEGRCVGKRVVIQRISSSREPYFSHYIVVECS